MHRLIAILAVALLGVECANAFATSPKEILESNTRAIVFIQIENADGGFVNSGTGFIVSQDGFILTAAHLKADPVQRAYATIGQRDGTRYKIELREADDGTDTALWKLPQSPNCRQSVVLTKKPVRVLDRAVALGFPERDGLTPAAFSINNLNGAYGFFKADGLLRHGHSGGPVFNEDGRVIAFVEGGVIAGAEANDLVPIAPAISLLTKYGVEFSLENAKEFARSCYASCRNSAHGVERWTTEVAWNDNSGWLSGGNNRQTQCTQLITGAQASSPGSIVELLPGEGSDRTGMWEESKKDIFGHVEYKYFCQGKLKSGPIYKQLQSPACGLWN